MRDVQLNMFSTLGSETESREDRMFREAVQSGSGFSGDKERIRKMIQDEPFDFRSLCDRIAKEYGTGGHSLKDGFLEYDSRSFRILDYKTRWNDPKNGLFNQYTVTKYSWAKVVKKILDLIEADEY